MVKLCFILLCVISLNSQRYTATHYSLEDGLTQGSVFDFHQDKQGFLWMATGDGLNRYDGYQFLHFGSNPQDSSTLSHRITTQIEEDLNGIFWVGTQNGLNRFDPLTGRASYVKEASVSDRIFQLVLKDSTLWILTRTRLRTYNIHTHKTTHYPLPESVQRLYNIQLVDSNTAYLTSVSGFIKYDLNTKRSRYVHPKNTKINYARHVAQYNDSTLFVSYAYNEGFYRYNTKTETFIKEETISQLGKNYVTYIKIMNGVLYLSYNNSGVVVYDDIKKKHLHTFHQENQLLINNSAQIIFHDKNGTLWISTYDSGITKLVQPYKGIYAYQYSGKNALHRTYEIFQDSEQNIWFGTNYGLLTFDSQTHQFHPTKTDPFLAFTIREDRHNVWFLGQQLVSYSKKKQHYTVHTTPEPFIFMENKNEDTLLFFSDKTVWTYTSQNIFKPFPFPKHISTQNIRSLTYTKKGIWYIQDQNLHLYEKATQQIHTFNQKTDPKRVSRIFLLHPGTLWLSSDYGFYTFSAHHFSSKHYTTQDGLSNNVTLSIIKENNHSIWISTNNGITHFTQPNTFNSYYKIHGLATNEHDNAYAKLNNGKMVFSGYGGVNVVQPNNIEHPPQPALLISSIQTPEHTDQHVQNNSVYMMDYTSNSFTVTLASDQFLYTSKQQYAYQINSGDWKQIGTSHRVTLAELPYGKNLIKFRVKTHCWSLPKSIYVHVNPPFWQTWWFILSCVLLIGSIIYFILSLRIKHIKRINDLRIKVSSDLHDDIGATLTQMSLMLDYSKQKTDIHDIKSIMNEVSELSRSSVESMSDIVWAMDTRNDTLGNLIGRMEDFIARLKRTYPIQIYFTHHGFTEDKSIQLQLRKNIFLIFKEAVTNILKYGNASQINVSLDNRTSFNMTISHDGKGQEFQRKKTGHGIRNMKQRAQQSQLQLEIDPLQHYKTQLLGEMI